MQRVRHNKDIKCLEYKDDIIELRLIGTFTVKEHVGGYAVNLGLKNNKYYNMNDLSAEEVELVRAMVIFDKLERIELGKLNQPKANKFIESDEKPKYSIWKRWF